MKSSKSNLVMQNYYLGGGTVVYKKVAVRNVFSSMEEKLGG